MTDPAHDTTRADFGSEFDRRRSKKPGKTKQKKLGKHRFFRRRAIERGGEATVMEHR